MRFKIKRSSFGLYARMLIVIYDSKNTRNLKGDKNSAKEICTKLCRCFSMTKFEMKQYLTMFQETQCLSISKTGIELNYEVVNG
jgi:hypothetical protein